MAENKMVEIENPCYHCREGAVDECCGCRFACFEWARDVEADTVKIREDYLDGRE